MSARRFNFSASLQSNFLYADSSFILNLITTVTGKTERFKSECEKFFKRIESEINKSGFCLTTSDIAADEVCFQVIKTKYELKLRFRDGSRTYTKWKEFYKNRPEFIAQYKPQIDALFDFLEATPFLILNSDYFSADYKDSLYLYVKELIQKYYLLPADAYHIAIGKASYINDFVAIDEDWNRVARNWDDSSDFNLFTCLPS